MNNKIFFIGGGKGGVGKSLVTISSIYLLQENNIDPLLIETDTSNPDTYKIFKNEIEVKTFDLDVNDGWINFVNLISETNKPIIVNTAARNNISLNKYSAILQNTLSELKRKVITLWVVNRQRDSVELLKQYTEIFPQSDKHEINVIKNLFFGDETKFQLFDDSKLKGHIQENGGLIIDFPELADRVCDEIYSKRLSIKTALEHQPIGNRAEILRWIKIVRDNLKGTLLK
jgi:hypothetical protein